MYLDILKKGALEGGAVLKQYFQKQIEVALKTSIQDIVTVADHEAQAAIVGAINKSVKGSFLEGKVGFIGEENLITKGEYTFVIDPLDGTNNFAIGIDFFCVAIALFKGNKLLAGLIYDVVRDNFYWGEKGKGAYKNGKKLRIGKNIKIQDAVLYASPPNVSTQRKRILDIIRDVSQSVRTFRMVGSIALEICRVTEGVGNLALHGGCNIWDLAASKLILNEAGGVVLDLEGSELKLNLDNIKINYFIAGEKKLILQFLELLKK